MTDQGRAVTIPEDDGGPEEPPRGAQIGRFIVLNPLGRGGMGVVLSAYDPELDRKVALKLLRTDLADDVDERRESLLAEARAMARLSHPNVVSIYEVGFVAELGYVVMEEVAGHTLSTWMTEAPRSWQEILRLYVAAGAGLAAAHQAGVIHRDFKPDNVLVDAAGRPRVTDFGLAAGLRTGAVAGTPAYMAPEQAAGELSDARADQYAFCVALWEALQGARPESHAPAVPREKRAPAWVYVALARGLAAKREDRWPDMTALLAALAPRASRGRTIAAAAALVTVGVTAFAIGSAKSSPCAGAEDRLAGVWDDRRRDAVRAAFTATGLPYAADTWRTVSARLDDYAGKWVDMRVETCRATRVENSQSEALMDLRFACLEQRRAVLGALTDVWLRGVDGDTLAAATEAGGALPSLAECADARALTDRVPPPASPALGAMVAAARAHLHGVEALILAQRLREARVAVIPARAQAEATGWAHVRAEAAFAEGQVRHLLDDPGAEPHFIAAAKLAGEAHDDNLAARALIELAGHLAADQQSASRALIVADVAEGVLARAGKDPRRTVELLANRAEALQAAGKPAEARVVLASARALATAALGPNDRTTLRMVARLARVAEVMGDYAGARALGEESLAAVTAIMGTEHPLVAEILNNLGMAVDAGGDRQAAAGYYRRALALKEKVLGPEAVSTANTLNSLGGLELMLGHVDEADRLLGRALAIREKVLGREHPFVGMTLSNLGVVRRTQGRFAEAIALLERALAICTAAYGPEHPQIGNTLGAIATVYEKQGDLERAIDYFRRARDVREKTLGAGHARTLGMDMSIAAMLAHLGRCRESLPLAIRAVTGFEKVVGREHRWVADALVTRSECDLAESRAAQAVGQLEEALAIKEKVKVAPRDRSDAHWLLARALWSVGKRDAALAAARLADEELEGDGDEGATRRAVRAWLAARARPVR